MKKVGILKNWGKFWMPDERFLDQSADGGGIQGDYRFQIGYAADCDYLVVLNRPMKRVKTQLPRSKIIGVVQEPPNEIYVPWHRGQRAMGHVLNQKHASDDGRYVLSHPMIPWFVNRSRNELQEMKPFSKSRSVSCITSKTTFFKGHLDRINFREKLNAAIHELELYGWGIRSVEDKWDALAPYQYSVVMENTACPYYWTEKIADCFLSWTFPIYYGCTNLEEYFPSESFMRIDFEDPDMVARIIERVSRPPSSSEIEAIAESRRRVLEEHHFFPRLARFMDSLDRGSDTDRGAVCVESITAPFLSSWVRAYYRKFEVDVLRR